MASLRDQLRELENPNPTFGDPEDFLNWTNAKLTDRNGETETADLENQFGSLRNRLPTLLELDEKYHGKRISRKDINEDSKAGKKLDSTEYIDDELKQLIEDSKYKGLDDGDEDNDDEDVSDINDDYDDADSDDDFDEDDNDSDISGSQIDHDTKTPEVYDEAQKKDEIKEDDTQGGNDNDKDNDNDDDNDEEMLEHDVGTNVNDEKGDEDDEDDEDDEQMNDVEEEDAEYHSVNQVLDKKVDDDVSKGNAVKSQLELWDKLMEMRIKLQKCLQLSNKYPQHDLLPDFNSASGVHLTKAQGHAKAALTSLMGELLSLQEVLYLKNKETKNILVGTSTDQVINDSDEEIASDTDEENEPDAQNSVKELHGATQTDSKALNPLNLPSKMKKKLKLSDYEDEISKRHQAFQDFRDKTIAKWDEKTKLSSGKLRSKTFAAFDRSAVAQIKQILIDKERLIKRTQLKRSIYRVFGKPEKQAKEANEDEQDDVDSHLKNYDSEIFDDSDFYHQLIKELIERKSNLSETSDPIAMGRQWLELQRWRRKMKKKVDVKASKGRRVRYSVHQKLVSFMAPIDTGTMDDRSRNELFKSLFGNKDAETGR